MMHADAHRSWSVRPLAETDLEAYLDIYLNSYPAYKDLDRACRDHYREKHRRELREDTQTKTVGLFEGANLIATMKLILFSMNFFGQMQPACGLMALEVHPLHKKKGAALFMVRCFEDYARENGALLTLLLPFRIDFYRRMGYGFAGKIYEYHLPTSALPKPDRTELPALTGRPAPRRLPKFRRRRLHNRPSPRHQPKSRRRHPHDRPPHRSLPPNGCNRGGVTWFSVYFRPRRTLRGAASSCCARRRRWLSGSIPSVRSTWSRPSPRRIAASASVSRGNTVRRGPTCGFTRKNEFSRFVGNPCCRCVLLASAGRGSLAAVVPLRLLRRDESGAGCGVVFRDLSLSDR